MANPMISVSSECGLPASNSRIPRDFTITTDSYISLCSRVYTACCSASPSFAKTVPESAFQYYAIILLWKRFADILPNSAKRDSEFFDEIAQLGSSYYIPAPLLTYLQGIGYFRDSDGCDRRFVLPVTPINEKIAGVLYTFGKVNNKSHPFYIAFPAPGIAALRIQADLRYTEDTCDTNLLWNLPEELCADVAETKVEPHRPTKNLLGWAPAQRLTASHLKFFKELQIDDNFMPKSFSSEEAVFSGMFKKINHYFLNWSSTESNDSPFAVNAKPGAMASMSGLSVNGSLVQGMTIVKHCDSVEFDRSTMYCEGNLSVSSAYEATDTLYKSAVVTGYRMFKQPVGDIHCWSCYDFNKYKNVPPEWIETRNSVYTFGEVGRLNELLYNTAQISKIVLQKEFIEHALFVTPGRWNNHL